MLKYFTVVVIVFLEFGQSNAGASGYSFMVQGEWIKKFPYCSGLSQSPINIETYNAKPQNCEKCLQWSNYHNVHPNMTIKYSEHSVEISAKWLGVPHIAFGALNGEYRLEQIHYHAGEKDYDGSEHCFNSQKLPFELHLLHIKTTYTTLAEAVASKDREALVVVARLYQVSDRPNPALTPMLNAIRDKETVTDNNLKLGSLVGLGNQNYYTYLGSLTTPECNEIVRWIVMEEVHTMSNEQLKIIRQITHNDVPMVPNNRLLQPLNLRPVYYYQCWKVLLNKFSLL